MSPYQTRMIPVDNILIHLETALNTEKMKAVFQQQLYPDLSTCIETCQIQRIKYKPQKNCHVSYRLRFNNNHRNYTREQLLCARFYEPGGSMSRFLKESVKDSTQNSLLHIPELDCVTWVFPNDRKLNNLELITDAGFLYRQVSPKLVFAVYGSDWSISEFASEMIRYVPEQNCTVRIQLQIDHNLSNEQKDLIAYGKACYNTSGKKIYQIMCQLWQSEVRRKARLNIPEPLCYQAHLHMLWLKGVPGVMLSELHNNRALFLKSIADAARQIACLHQVSLPDCPPRNQVSLLQELGKVRQLLYKFKSPGRNKTIHIIDRLAALFSSTEPEQQAVLHGDLHLKNILVADDAVFLIDLDNISLGNPLQDLGSFIAAILNLKLLTSISMPLAEQTIKIFLQAYYESCPWTVCNSSLRKYIANALIVERVFRSFTRLKAGRMEIIDDLVKQAELILDDSVTPGWLQVTS